MHDFAEALQDMGVSEAISLVGGDAYMYWWQDNELYETYDLSKVKNNNFIVFREKGKQWVNMITLFFIIAFPLCHIL